MELASGLKSLAWGEDYVSVANGHFLRLPCVWWQVPAAQSRKKSNCQKPLVVVTS